MEHRNYIIVFGIETGNSSAVLDFILRVKRVFKCHSTSQGMFTFFSCLFSHPSPPVPALTWAPDVTFASPDGEAEEAGEVQAEKRAKRESLCSRHQPGQRSIKLTLHATGGASNMLPVDHFSPVRRDCRNSDVT